MIDRTLIRTKVLQILYAYHQKDSKNLKVAEKELNISLQKTHYLYHYLFLLIIKLADAEQKKLDKLIKYEYPLMQFADNFLVKQLRNHPILMQFDCLQNDYETVFIELLLNEIKQSESYAKYISSENIYKNDYKLWKVIFEQIVLKSQIVSEWLEQKSIYWNGELEIIAPLMLKTLKQFQNKPTSEPISLSLFKNNTLQKYAIQLLCSSITEAKKNSDLIDVQMKNWKKERIALLDLIIMQMALTEINNFPTIPLKVTLNEYIDLARYYSTPKSTSFVNGVLQAIISLLKIKKN